MGSIDKDDSLSHNNDGVSSFVFGHRTKEELSMPTERFYRLPKEKADTIRNAAIQEFKRVPPEEASINKIIQRADISRGSFYTYFEDKYDLLKWLMGDFIENYQRFYLISLEENRGDLWEVFEKVLTYTMDWVAEQGLVEIVGNMMKGTFFADHVQAGAKGNCDMEKSVREYTRMLYQRVDQSVCELDLEDFEELMRMHVTSLVVSLKLYFIKEEEPETIIASYRRRMRLLRYGACPRAELK